MSRRLLEGGRLQDFFNPKVLYHSRKLDTITYCYGSRIAWHRTLKWREGIRYSKPNGDRTDLLPLMHACLRQSGNMFLDYCGDRKSACWNISPSNTLTTERWFSVLGFPIIIPKIPSSTPLASKPTKIPYAYRSICHRAITPRFWRAGRAAREGPACRQYFRKPVFCSGGPTIIAPVR